MTKQTNKAHIIYLNHASLNKWITKVAFNVNRILTKVTFKMEMTKLSYILKAYKRDNIFFNSLWGIYYLKWKFNPNQLYNEKNDIKTKIEFIYYV